VLLPAYRGRGLGHAFFDHREAHARALNAAGAQFQHATFCGVVRPNDDPRMPPGYRPLDGFWHKRQYAPISGMTGNYDWREVGGAAKVDHAMQFWVRAL
jgi:GNAT superfamily N-acetyltransferase